jgi:protein-tyrosine-phosphatase
MSGGTMTVFDGHLLFVCGGNTCRSPMAAGIFGKLCRERPDRFGEAVRCYSAGTMVATTGAPATLLAIRVMGERGVDITGHESRGLTRPLLDWANLVLVMESSHREQICRFLGRVPDTVALLTEYAGETGDVPDPLFANTLTSYRNCADHLDRLVRTAFFDRPDAPIRR